MKILIDRLTAERKAANRTFQRNDPYGRGLKRGLDRAISHAKGIRDGLEYDEADDCYFSKDDDEAAQ